MDYYSEVVINMGVLEIVITILLVVLLYKATEWVLAKLKVTVPGEILTIAFLLLLILALMGRVSLGL